METVTLKREFILKRGGKTITIPDPNPDHTLSQVADMLSGEYPEVLNANFKGPEHKEGKLIYEISGTYGTKG